MGYYLELQEDDKNQPVTIETLRQRLESAGVVPHPGRGENNFGDNDFWIPELGLLELSEPGKFETGRWGWIRLSWIAERWQFERLIAISEKIGGQIYDASIGLHVTRDSLDSIMAQFCDQSSRVINAIGAVGAADEGQWSYRCTQCGQYAVPEWCLRERITNDLNRGLNEAVARGAVGAVLIFDDGCPRCDPRNEYQAAIAALTPSKSGQ